jgi:two-component system KDP operon response regulator KdpE
MSLVLIVEDDPTIHRVVRDNLRFERHEVLSATDGETGYRLALEKKPDVIILDLMLPAMTGLEVCRKLREESFMAPIIMLTARSEEGDRVLGLDLGADDYVTKPVSLPELLARVRTQLRRSAPEKPVLRFPDLVLDSLRRRVTVADREVRLTPREFAILELLAGNAGRPISAEQILRRVWGTDQHATTDAVRVHVSGLRRKIEPDPSNPRFIVTEPWVGYRFIAEPLD